MTDERADLQRQLAEAEARLAALPLSHTVKHPHSVMARRTALEVKITSLRARISTAPVHKLVEPVGNSVQNVHESECLDGQESETTAAVHNTPQGGPQAH